MSKIDNNNKYVGLAFNGTITAPLKVDSVTGRLLIDVVSVASTTPEDNFKEVDENSNNVSLASDGTNVKNLLIDSRNGYLWLDLEIET
jgi:hypothetical protein